jgi:hypothetical protein
MNSTNDSAKNYIVDFIDDEIFYVIKKSKEEIEKRTLSIYLFATVSLFSYVIYLLLNREPFEWLDFGINIILITIYYCLAVYSNYKPFTAFVTILCIVTITLVMGIIFSSQPGIKGIIIKIIFIVYISLNIEAAKKVQEYESNQMK